MAAAQSKYKRRMNIGTAILVLSLVGATGALVMVGKANQEAERKTVELQKAQQTVKELKQQQAPQSQPEVKQSPETGATKPINPFDKALFPQDSCGDEFPNNSKTETVKFYPVFIDYNESNLRTVKANYCRDAFIILRKDKGQEAIQVASFISKERATQFKEFLGNKLGSVSLEVAEPK